MYRIQFDSVLTGKNPGNYITIFEIYFTLQIHGTFRQNYFFQGLILMTKPCVSWPWDSLHIASSPGHCVTR